MGCWSRWSLPAELQRRSEITEPRCTARYLRLRRPSKGDAHARGGRKTTARPHNEEMSLQPISSFWQFSINKLLDVYSEVWINHGPRCVPDFFFFVSFFLNDNWLIAFSYLIKVHFFRCKKQKWWIHYRWGVSALVFWMRTSACSCLLCVKPLSAPFLCHSTCNIDAIINSFFFFLKQDSLDEKPKQIRFSRHISVSPLLLLSSLQLVDL